MILRKNSSVAHVNGASCTAREYGFGDKDIDVAVIEINGRYPEKGLSSNDLVKEIVCVTGGSGSVTIDGRRETLAEGDSVLILPKQKFVWEGKLRLVVSCSPAWSKEQYRHFD